MLALLLRAFIDATAAQALVGHATILDARDGKAYAAGHVPGAVRIDWEAFRDGWGRTGRVDDDDARLGRKLGALGIGDGPVLVYGAGKRGWGEEGRIAWMLAYLGHPNVQILDGGYAAWRGAIEKVDGRPKAATFVVRRTPALRAELSDVERAVRDHDAVVIDTRSVEEWNGATPYHESRGGHIPTAHHLVWSALLGSDGKLLPIDALERAFASVGIEKERPVIVYCTGGVRSAFVWDVLHQLGYDARNFDGSFWQWAAEKRLPVDAQN